MKSDYDLFTFLDVAWFVDPHFVLPYKNKSFTSHTWNIKAVKQEIGLMFYYFCLALWFIKPIFQFFFLLCLVLRVWAFLSILFVGYDMIYVFYIILSFRMQQKRSLCYCLCSWCTYNFNTLQTIKGTLYKEETNSQEHVPVDRAVKPL